MSAVFDHDELDVAGYSGDFAAYAIGRLLVRMEWHLEQAVMLSPGPIPEMGDSSLGDLLERHCPDQKPSTWIPVIKGLKDRMASDVARHSAAVHRSLEYLERLIRQLPISRSLVIAADFEKKLRGLIERAISPDTASDVADANLNYRGCCELPAQEEQDCNSRDREFRQEKNRLLVERVVTKPLLPLTADFHDLLNDQQRHLFTLGSSLEASLCPPDVHFRLAAPSLRVFLEGRGRRREPLVDRVGRWLIAFESREVGELRPRPDWLSRLRMDLVAFAGEQEEVVEQLIRSTQLQYDKRTLDHKQLTDFVRQIHSSITSQFRGAKGGDGGNGGDKPAEPKLIPWEHGVLEIDESGNAGTFSYLGQQLDLNTSTEIRLVKFLMQRFERQCTYEELRGAIRGDSKGNSNRQQGQQRNNDVQKHVSLFQPKANQIGLTIAVVRGIGYQLIPSPKSG